MIKSKRRVNKAMLVANVIAFRSAPFYNSMAFYSVKHNDFVAVPSVSVTKGWHIYGWMVNEAGKGGRWSDPERFVRMGYKRVSN